MRVGLDMQSTLGRPTGIGRYALQLLRALRDLGTDHEFIPLSRGREVVMRTDRRLAWQQIGLPRRARAEGVDLLHVTGFDAPLIRPCPVVLTVHDLIGALFPALLPPVSRWYWGRWLPRTVRSADVVIADSEATRADLVRLTGRPPESVEVILLGVDPCFRPLTFKESEPTLARYGLNRPYLLFVGTREPRKGLDTLLEAYGRLAVKHPHELVLVGAAGWGEPEGTPEARPAAWRDRVRVLDYVPNQDLPAVYSGAAALALPSRYEGFGLPVLEAMACGVPVVCSNAASLPEAAGGAALLVPPDDPQALAKALERVLTDPDLAGRLRQQGLDRAGRLTWEKTARQTLAVYERAVGIKRRGRICL